MSSTPKHLAMYQAFGWEPPSFAHVGLLLDKDRRKLSKRTGSIDVAAYRAMGIFPETLTNFVALLGWSHNSSKDFMSMEELIHNASMKYTRGDSVVGFEKLNFLQKRHAARYAAPPEWPDDNPLHSLRELATKPIADILNQRVKKNKAELPVYASIAEGQAREDYIHAIVLADAQNYQNPTEFITRHASFFIAPSTAKLAEKVPSLRLHKIPSGVSYSPDIDTLKLFHALYQYTADEWTIPNIRKTVLWAIEQGTAVSLAAMQEKPEWTPPVHMDFEVMVGKAWTKLVHGYLRWALAGGAPGPDTVEVMGILGRKQTVTRLERAEKVVRESRAKGEGL